MKNLLLLFLVVMLAACKASKPKGVLSEEKMERILYDYHLAKAMAEASDSADVKGRAYILACLKKHGVTEAEFDTSMVWYFQHMIYLQKIYQRIDERYNQELASLGASTNEVNRYSTLSATGDTANVWNDRSFYLFSGNGFNNRMAFEIKADTSYKPADRYMLNFRAEFLQKEGPRHGYATLAVQYDNDSVSHTDRHIYGSGDHSLILPTANRPIKRIYGFIYMLAEWNVNPRLLFIFNPSLVRMHTVVEKPQPQQNLDTLKVDSTSVIADSATAANATHSLSEEQIHSRPVPRMISKDKQK